jgi:microcystin-dependent protein
MAVLQTGQSFSSGDQVTATKLQDIANLATFRTGANQTADDSTIQVDGSGGYLKVKSAGISSNELATDSVVTAKIQDGAVTAAKLDTGAVSVLMPTATVLPYAGSTAPTGYLVCAGQSVLVADYGDLYDVIGFTYGGSGPSFNLPDLRGRVIAGQDNMGGTSADVLTDAQADQLGGTLGEEDHILTVNEMPSHTHGLVIDSGSDDDFGTSGGNTNNVSSGSGNTSATGGGAAHNNVQPTIILNYIIKT